MEERRKEVRKYLTYFSRVIDRETGLLLGYLVDLTTGGALMVSSMPIKTNVVFNLRVDLPEGFASQGQFDLQAKSIWSQPDTDPEFYRTGLQLLEIRPIDLLTLEQLLSNYGLRK
jgi:hypothetical protein